MEYLLLALFIASSGAESEISQAADRWAHPSQGPWLLGLCRSLGSPRVALCFLPCPCLLFCSRLCQLSLGFCHQTLGSVTQ